MEVRNLPVALTEVELNERRDKVVDLIDTHDQIEMKKKKVAADLKAELEEVDREIRGVTHEIRTRSENRPVEVRRDKDYHRRVEEVVRLDTGEVVETRALYPSELQGELTMLDGKMAVAG